MKNRPTHTKIHLPRHEARRFFFVPREPQTPLQSDPPPHKTNTLPGGVRQNKVGFNLVKPGWTENILAQSAENFGQGGQTLDNDQKCRFRNLFGVSPPNFSRNISNSWTWIAFYYFWASAKSSCHPTASPPRTHHGVFQPAVAFPAGCGTPPGILKKMTGQIAFTPHVNVSSSMSSSASAGAGAKVNGISSLA